MNSAAVKIGRIVIPVLLVYASLSFANVLSDLNNAEQTMSALETEIVTARQKNEELTAAIEHAGEDASIEQLARERLGLVKPGEIVFVDAANYGG